MIVQRKSSLWFLAALLVMAACTPTASIETDSEDGQDTGELAATGEPATEMPTDLPPEPTLEQEEDTPTSSVEDEKTDGEVGDEDGDPEISKTVTEDQFVLDDGTVVLTEDDRSNRLQQITAAWGTNWNLHTINYDEILSGGPPRDGIPSIDNPLFITQDEASTWLAGNEPVIAVELNGEARAYPLQILTWHEIVNDQIGETPVLITFCPLCNSAIVFERTLDGEAVAFGTSGLLRNSDLIMYDRTTESLWQQFTGDAIVGDMVGTRLTFLASSLISFDDFRAAYPEGTILSRETGIARPYGENPYVGYDTIGSNPFLFTGELDGRLPAVERVVTVSLADVEVAYPLSILSEVGVINDTQGEHDLVVFHTGGTSSALGARLIAEAEDVGATGVFDPNVDGQLLTFRQEGDTFIDEETGSTWNIIGQAIDGPLAGKQLSPIIHGDHFWFSWAAFKPDTVIYQGQ